MHCGAGAGAEGSGRAAPGAAGGGRGRAGGGVGRGAVRGRSLYSLLPISEFSAGQGADGRFVVVPGVGGRVASVKRPEPSREEGWPDGGAGLGGTFPGTR